MSSPDTVALLYVNHTPPEILKISDTNAQIMEDIIVAGFPFSTTLSSSVKVTKGIVSSLAGIGNNYSTLQIDAANFKNADMRQLKWHNEAAVNFSEADLRGAAFTTSKLKGSKFINSKLDGATFFHTNLTKVDFTGAQISGVYWQWAKFSKTKMPSGEVKNTDC